MTYLRESSKLFVTFIADDNYFVLNILFSNQNLIMISVQALARKRSIERLVLNKSYRD